MVSKRKSIKTLVEDTQELERKLQGEAFELLQHAGDYDFSESMLAIARDVRSIGRRLESIAADQGSKKTKQIEAKPKKKRVQYPQFFVAQDRIIKIGRGKSKGAKEYRHEAPLGAFEALVRWMESVEASGTREWMGTEAAEALSGQVPSYQVYLMLGALREVGVLKQVQRGSYEIGERGSSSSEYWSLLRSRLSQSS